MMGRWWRGSMGLWTVPVMGLTLAVVLLSPCPFLRAGEVAEVLRWDQWRRVVLLNDYNSRIVVVGTTLLGLTAGLVGSFTLLRKRALMGDAISHAALPGIALAFIMATWLGANGKSLIWLLSGATLSGLAGMGSILAIRQSTRLKEDTALGVVLSVFFGGGVSLLGIIQHMEGGHAAGLEDFIYGTTASMLLSDAQLIGAVALACMVGCLLVYKELKILCFDEAFAGAQGQPVLLLDIGLMSLVVLITIVGLQAVGLILMIALLVTPAAAARFWTETMGPMTVIAAGLGALGAMCGAAASAVYPQLPSGPMIVLVCTLTFSISMMFGGRRGVAIRLWRRYELNRSVDRQHLLRAMYEILESRGELSARPGTLLPPVTIAELLTKRSWSARRLYREIRRAARAELLTYTNVHVSFTPRGLAESARLTRTHRLWEHYLIQYADIAPHRVDRDADAIEHVLGPEVVAELERTLDRAHVDVPASPHELAAQPGGRAAERKIP